jgi:hypothetical protein
MRLNSFSVCTWRLGATSRLLFALLLALALVVFARAADAEERRLALVIGNAEYTDITALRNSVNDARLMRETLAKLGFEVIYRENVNKLEMDRAISTFGAKLTAAGTSGVAVFYYAGHGVQSAGENYLLPLEAPIAREADLRLNAVRAEDVLAQMEAAQSGVKIVILDACRNNPFATRFKISSSGLAGIALGNSEFTVAYAATEGKLAEDGSGQNSPYALALGRRLTTPGAGLSDVFRLVRIDVSKGTGGRQLPEARTTMLREFYFNPVVGDKGEVVASNAENRVASALAGTAVKPTQLVGKWCLATRGSGFAMMISSSALDLTVQGLNNRFPVRSIELNAAGNVVMKWLNKNVPTVLEFGEFSYDGKSMTQLRGRAEADKAWKTYDLRFERC